MGGYTRYGPWTDGITPPGISAAFLNGVESVLARNSGDTETGKYIVDTCSYANTSHLGGYVPTISRTSVPVSVSIDSADALVNTGGLSTNHLTSNGFGMDGTASGPNLSVQVGGNVTVNY